jgi:DNA-binding transcriptional ArsR family regulator
MSSHVPLSVEGLMLSIASTPRRRALCELTKDDGLPVNELARRIGVSEASMSKHLSFMFKAGLLVRGYGRLYRIAPQYLTLNCERLG